MFNVTFNTAAPKELIQFCHDWLAHFNTVNTYVTHRNISPKQRNALLKILRKQIN